MLKILDKKTFKDIPKKEQDIFIQQGAEQQQEMFSAEESHQGLLGKTIFQKQNNIVRTNTMAKMEKSLLSI